LNTSPTIYAPPRGCNLDYVYRDESLLVVNKPPGLLSVPGRGADKTDSLTTRVQQEFPDALCVHRLDMSTSGLLVLARGKEMQIRLSQLFRERKVEKCYVAMITGLINSDVGEIDLPLGSDWPNRPRQKVDFTRGKNSLTRFRLLAHDAINRTSRVELEPVTGRTHQLRLHMAAIGHPIAGDPLYGRATGAAADRLQLHACMLGFIHPFSAIPLTLECEAPF
jgi:tRNA pseudouridine32 synthase/23S rRNA pseudouridine746 synthase